MKLTKQGVRDLSHLKAPSGRKVALPPDRPDTGPEPCPHCGSRRGSFLDKDDYLLVLICRGCGREI